MLDLLRSGEEIPFSRENRRALVEAIYLAPAKGGENLPRDMEQPSRCRCSPAGRRRGTDAGAAPNPCRARSGAGRRRSIA